MDRAVSLRLLVSRVHDILTGRRMLSEHDSWRVAKLTNYLSRRVAEAQEDGIDSYFEPDEWTELLRKANYARSMADRENTAVAMDSVLGRESSVRIFGRQKSSGVRHVAEDEQSVVSREDDNAADAVVFEMKGRQDALNSMRRELLGDYEGMQLQRRENRNSSAELTVEDSMDLHRKAQESIAGDMIEMVQALKANAITSGKIVLDDIKTLEKAENVSMLNMDGLRKQANRLRKEIERSGSWWMLLLVVAITGVFFFMIMIISIT
eukprot:Clim_evm91s207 gene=Clim_evmTU91s207